MLLESRRGRPGPCSAPHRVPDSPAANSDLAPNVHSAEAESPALGGVSGPRPGARRQVAGPPDGELPLNEQRKGQEGNGEEPARYG